MRWKTAAVLAVAAIGVGAAFWASSRPQPVKVAMVKVERGVVRQTVSNTRAGTVDACNRAKMAPILGGQIASLPVSEGDRVVAGQVLLELWNEDIRAQVLLAEKDRLAAGARADEACTAASVAERESRRLKQLLKQRLTSEEAADQADGVARQRAAACRASRSMIEVSDAQITAAIAALERTIVRAPFDGIVAEINGEIGEVVTPSPVGVPTLPAVDLIDSACIYVTAPIDEVDAPAIRAGMKASITLDAFPDQSFDATVRRVAPYVLDREKQARTVDIEAEFDRPSEDLLPGYSADVEVTLESREDVLRIPTSAIIDGSHVLTLDGEGVIRETPIEIGLQNWQVTEVTSGLQAGESIVTSIDRTGVEPGVPATAEAS